MTGIEAVLARHTKIALHFSGGKDSTACLYLMRPYLDRITVYWANTGDAVPETQALIDRCREFIPHFVEVRSDVTSWIDANGYPSDLVPTNSSEIGRLLGFGKTKIADRFGCCYANVMLPMHERMRADGITCVIRGQKLSDMSSVPHRSGEVPDGIELFYPLENWSDQDVFDYLLEAGAPIHPVYDYNGHGLDCAHCTGWWKHNHFNFMKDRHPQTFAEIERRFILIRAEINNQVPPDGE